MKFSKVTVLKSLITLLQILMLVPPLLLQYLSNRKMGVMRYLVFKKDVLSKDFFTSSFTFTYMCILLLGIIFCIIFLIYTYTKRINTALTKPIGILLLFNLICVFSYKFQLLMSYHFFLVAFGVIIILQYIKIIVLILQNTFSKKVISH